MSIRPVKSVVQARPTLEGAGVKLRRAFGFGNTDDFDPFLLFDDFRNENPEDYLAGFPWHPHRGIETITYVLAGTVAHGDSLGNKGNLGAGDVQWMTAGSGILHQEMPKGDAQGRMHGFQLWANLPASLKMTAPRYQDVIGRDIPEITDDDGTTVPLVCGDFWGKRGRITASRRDDRAGRPGRHGTDGRQRRRQPFAGAVRQRRRNHGSGRRRGDSVPARVRQPDRGTGRVVRSDRHEHRRAAASGVLRTAFGHVHQTRIRQGSRLKAQEY